MGKICLILIVFGTPHMSSHVLEPIKDEYQHCIRTYLDIFKAAVEIKLSLSGTKSEFLEKEAFSLLFLLAPLGMK